MTADPNITTDQAKADPLVVNMMYAWHYTDDYNEMSTFIFLLYKVIPNIHSLFT